MDKERIMKMVEERYSKATHDDETYALADECIDLAYEFLEENKDNIKDKSRRQVRLELRKFIKDRINLSDTEKAYFVPTFVWVWAAQQIITWLVKIILENYLEDSSDNES